MVGTVLRAGTGLWLALWLMGEAPSLAAIPGLSAVRADIGAAHPNQILRKRMDAGWEQLSWHISAHNGTDAPLKPADLQAHPLQPQP